MVIDTSALLAVLLRDSEAERLVQAIADAHSRRVAAPTLVEASAVMLGRKGPQGDIALSALLRSLNIEVVAMSDEAAEHARSAYARYGKGVGEPGVLDLGDCLSYGVAKALDEPLLFVGDDFGETDIVPA